MSGSPQHWLLRIGDGVHFVRSSPKGIWGIASAHPGMMSFKNNVKEGDLLWFVKSGSRGLLVAVATFVRMQARELGPLIDLTLTNEELGWTETVGVWDTEVHYTDLYNVSALNLLSEIASPLEVRRYNEKCKVNLPVEYPLIVRYSAVSRTMVAT